MTSPKSKLEARGARAASRIRAARLIAEETARQAQPRARTIRDNAPRFPPAPAAPALAPPPARKGAAWAAVICAAAGASGLIYWLYSYVW